MSRITNEKAIRWLVAQHATVKFDVVKSGDDIVPIVRVTVPGKIGCRVTRKTFLSAVSAAMGEQEVIEQVVIQGELPFDAEQPALVE